MDFAKLIAPYARAINNMLGRGSVNLIDATGTCQRLQITLEGGSPKDGIEQIEPYGFTAHAHPGAEHVSGFMAGERGNGFVIVVGDRRYRMKGLAEGEVALYDDLGQSVYLTRGGIVINGGANPIRFTNASKVRIEAPLEVTGDVKDNCDSSGKTMAAMRSTFNGHTHNDPQGGATGGPNSTM